jgi:translation initiation factor 1
MKKRIPVDGGQSLTQSPFANLSLEGLPPGPAGDAVVGETSNKPKKRGRVDILRQTAHRGGKTVTVIRNFQDIRPGELEELARRMQKECGTGGTVKDGQIEIQGDRRAEVSRILTEAGFRPVLAGG